MPDAGMAFQRIERRGEGTLVFLHATGLNASAYRPLLERTEGAGTILAPSLRGHGASTLPADPARIDSFRLFADDLVEALRGGGIARPLTLAGHSAGAVSALLAARVLTPERLLMIEPVVLPRLAVWLARSPLKPLTIDRIPIARKAAARRASFASREEVARHYAAKPFFAAWHPDALAGYLREGLREDGAGVRLACDPAWEAAVFSAQAHGFWPHLGEVRRRGVGVMILAAEQGSTFPPERRPRARRMGAEVTEWAGSHMMPVEDVDAVAGWLSARLPGAGSSRV